MRTTVFSARRQSVPHARGRVTVDADFTIVNSKTARFMGDICQQGCDLVVSNPRPVLKDVYNSYAIAEFTLNDQGGLAGQGRDFLRRYRDKGILERDPCGS